MRIEYKKHQTQRPKVCFANNAFGLSPDEIVNGIDFTFQREREIYESTPKTCQNAMVPHLDIADHTPAWLRLEIIHKRLSPSCSWNQAKGLMETLRVIEPDKRLFDKILKIAGKVGVETTTTRLKRITDELEKINQPDPNGLADEVGENTLWDSISDNKVLPKEQTIDPDVFKYHPIEDPRKPVFDWLSSQPQWFKHLIWCIDRADSETLDRIERATKESTWQSIKEEMNARGFNKEMRQCYFQCLKDDPPLFTSDAKLNPKLKKAHPGLSEHQFSKVARLALDTIPPIKGDRQRVLVSRVKARRRALDMPSATQAETYRWMMDLLREYEYRKKVSIFAGRFMAMIRGEEGTPWGKLNLKEWQKAELWKECARAKHKQRRIA